MLDAKQLLIQGSVAMGVQLTHMQIELLVLYITEFENTIWGYTEKGLLFQLDMKTGKRILENQLKNLPVSNLEFVDGNSFYYYCEAGLIQFDIKSKAENSVLLRNSIDDNAGDAFIKLIR